MTAVWDGDTGTVTITATTAAGPVNLTGSTQTVITKSLDTGTSSELTIDTGASNLSAGVVVASAAALGPGSYKLVMRVVAGSVTATYPSADEGPEKFDVHPDLDAV
jgi:hypothetical protein